MNLFGLRLEKPPLKTKINIRLTPEATAVVEQYREKAHCGTFTAAVERLIWAGAKAEGVIE